MKDLDWNNLRVVLAISRTGSLTGAAKHIQLDQTTAGRRLTALENSLGTALFRRARSGFVPTEAGLTVIAEARAIEAQLSGMTDRLLDVNESNSGIVRILGNAWMLAKLAEHALPHLLRDHPGLEVRLVSRLPPSPIYGEPTIALWFDAEAIGPDVARPVARIPFAAYRPKQAETVSSEWVIFRDDDATGPSFTREVRRRLGKTARIRLTGTDANILAAAIRGGVGQGILPVALGDSDVALQRSDANVGSIERVLHVHTSPEFEGIARVRTVLDWIDGALETAVHAKPLK